MGGGGGGGDKLHINVISCQYQALVELTIELEQKQQQPGTLCDKG